MYTVCVTVIIKHNYKLVCKHKIVINIMLCFMGVRRGGVASVGRRLLQNKKKVEKNVEN